MKQNFRDVEGVDGLRDIKCSLSQKLKSLPSSPGVYFHKSSDGEIIYVGKAAVLKNRVRQYFQSSRNFDAKTLALVAEIADTDWVETESEIDALFLESEMVKRYMPRYNILLRDDKSQIYIRIDMKSQWPTVTTVRSPADDEAEYFGPYYSAHAIRKALRFLRKSFPFFVKPPRPNGSSLEASIGLVPNINLGIKVYKDNLRKLIRYFEGSRKKLAKEIEADMKRAAESQDYELAAKYRNQLQSLAELQRRIMFGDSEFLDISKDYALADIANLFELSDIPKRIEGFDISHMGGTNVVASMVVFTNGASNRSEYRKFRTKIEQNNDFYNMNETILRRLSLKNIKDWGLPSLVLIDGGKGQLDAAIKARNTAAEKLDDEKLALKITKLPFVGLAKKEEKIVIKNPIFLRTLDNSDSSMVSLNVSKLQNLDGIKETSENFVLLSLPSNTHIIKLLQRIRDESHRFAVSYHSSLRRKRQTISLLDEITGVGPITKRKLIRKFGSIKNIANVSQKDLSEVVGKEKANIIIRVLHGYKE